MFNTQTMKLLKYAFDDYTKTSNTIYTHYFIDKNEYNSNVNFAKNLGSFNLVSNIFCSTQKQSVSFNLTATGIDYCISKFSQK